MKAFIQAVFICLTLFGVGVLVWQDYQTHQCRSAGYDQFRDGLCVYRSRYVRLEYLVLPNRADNWMVKVREYESEERHQPGGNPRK